MGSALKMAMELDWKSKLFHKKIIYEGKIDHREHHNRKRGDNIPTYICATESLCSGRETAQTIYRFRQSSYQGIYCSRNMCNATKLTRALGEMNFTFLAFTMTMDMYRAW